MNEELKITDIQATKINLQEGDVLMVTVNHEDLNQESLKHLKDKLDSLFPLNEVMVFGMGSEGYVKFTVASQPKLSYCSDCDCGKKEIAESQAKQEESNNDQS